MSSKNKLRKKFYLLRKKRYFEIDEKFFFPLIKFLKIKLKKKAFKIAQNYPSNFGLNVLKVLENPYISNKNTLLPAIEENNNMNFFPWKKNEVLFINKYGIPEPISKKIEYPDIILVPLVAFDKDLKESSKEEIENTSSEKANDDLVSKDSKKDTKESKKSKK